MASKGSRALAALVLVVASALSLSAGEQHSPRS